MDRLSRIFINKKKVVFGMGAIIGRAGPAIAGQPLSSARSITSKWIAVIYNAQVNCDRLER